MLIQNAGLPPTGYLNPNQKKHVLPYLNKLPSFLNMLLRITSSSRKHRKWVFPTCRPTSYDWVAYKSQYDHGMVLLTITFLPSFVSYCHLSFTNPDRKFLKQMNPSPRMRDISLPNDCLYFLLLLLHYLIFTKTDCKLFQWSNRFLSAWIARKYIALHALTNAHRASSLVLFLFFENTESKSKLFQHTLAEFWL